MCLINQEDMEIVKIYALNIGVTKYTKQTLAGPREKETINNSTDFSAPLSTMDVIQTKN